MSKLIEFDSFSEKIKDFFLNLAENNNKPWFDENRSFYEKEVKDKSKAFVAKIGTEFHNHNLAFIAESRLSLFRINRDIRFSKDKNPYKTNLGIFFPYSHNQLVVNKEYPLGMYLHFEPSKCFIATGIYNPAPPQLKNIRSIIADEYEEFLSLINEPAFKANFSSEMTMQKPLTRVAGYNNDHPAIEQLKRKDFTYSGILDDKIFFSKDLINIIIQKAESSVKYLDFLYKTIHF
jgi:uncharacterized protein (TIGR02453 family)